MDRRHLRRAHRIDVHGNQIKSDVDYVFGQCKQRRRNGHRRASHGYLAIGARPAMATAFASLTQQFLVIARR
jgi:hypothetical protein